MILSRIGSKGGIEIQLHPVTGVHLSDYRMRIGGQRAVLATRLSSAMRLAHGHSEGVELAEKTGPALLRNRRKSEPGEFGHRLIAFAIALRWWRQQLMALDDASQILVSNRDRMAERIEQNRVDGLWPHGWQIEQPAAQGIRGQAGKLCQGTVKLVVQHRYKGLQRRRLAALKAGGLDEFP